MISQERIPSLRERNDLELNALREWPPVGSFCCSGVSEGEFGHHIYGKGDGPVLYPVGHVGAQG